MPVREKNTRREPCTAFPDAAGGAHTAIAYGRSAKFPLLDICRKVLDSARSNRSLHHILIISQPRAAEVAPLAEAGDLSVFSYVPEAAIAHEDLLLALSMGVTHVLWQRAVEKAERRVQVREMKIAEYLGGRDRLSFFRGASDLAKHVADLSFLPLAVAPLPEGGSLIRGTRRDTALACAAFLLGRKDQKTPLPDTAPYGRVKWDADACTSCQKCLWVCPTGALSLDPEGGLQLTESACIQCGMCRSACASEALELEPRLNLTPQSARAGPLKPRETYPCHSCGVPAAPRGMMERIMDKLRLGVQMRASPDVQALVPICETCRREALRNGTSPTAKPARLNS